MLCPNCGKENDSGTVFCINCGAKVSQLPPPSAGNAYGEAPPRQSGQGAAAVDIDNSGAPLPTSEFTLMELIARIPIVNLVMFCVWGFGGDINENKRNWARSRLIWLGIGLALSIIGVLIGAGMASAIIAGLSDLTDHMSFH